MLQAAVDRFRRPVAGARPVEVPQHVTTALFQCPCEPAYLDHSRWNLVANPVSGVFQEELSEAPVFLAVRGDHVLVHAPDRFDFHVSLVSEQGFYSALLFLGQERSTGEQRPSGPVERVALPAAVAMNVVLGAAPTALEGIACEPDDVEWIHHYYRFGEFLASRSSEAAEAVHRDDLNAVLPVLWTVREPLFEHRFRAAFDHVEQPRRPGLLVYWGEIYDHGHVLVAEAGVSPHMLVNTNRGDLVEPGWVVDELPDALGKDRLVRS